MNSNDETTKSLEEIIKEYELKISENTSNSEEIALEYSRLLSNFVSSKLDFIKLKRITDELKKLDDKYNNKEIGLQYAKSLYAFTLKQKDKEEYKETLLFLKKLDKKYNYKKIGLQYAKSLYAFSLRDKEKEKYEEILSSLAVLDKKYSYKKIGLQYAKVLERYACERIEKEKYEEILSSLAVLDEKYNHDEIGSSYAHLLRFYMFRQIDKKESKDILRSLKKLEKKYNNKKIAIPYAFSLCNYIFEDIEKKEYKGVLSLLKKLEKKYNDILIAVQYASSLCNYIFKDIEREEYKGVLLLLKKLEKKYNHCRIGLEYVVALYYYKQLEKEQCKEIFSSLEELDKKYNDEELGFQYARILCDYICKQIEKEEYEDTLISLISLKRLEEKYNDEGIGFQYAKALRYYIFEQIDKKEYEDILLLFEKLSEKYNYNENICNKFLEIALNEEDFKLLILMLKKFGKKIITKKYHFFEYLNDKIQDKEKIIILKIFREIQTIMKILSVKKEDFNNIGEIGHYTNIEVIPYIIIKKIKNEDNFETKGKLLLSNANYMNDPSEGKILLEYLNTIDSSFSSLFYRNEFEVSSVYLSSFTTAIDNLPMWSQYGDNGKGCCIVFNKNYFDKPKEVHDILDKGKEKIYEDECVLYRICYIDDKNNEYKFQEKDKEIERCLKNISENLKNINNQNEKKIILKYLEQIRYLFKSSNYEHEEEYRILKNVPINSKKIITREDVKPVPKLYVKIESKLNQISEVILGPKVDFPDYISPYIKYCDEKIEIRKSKVKFR